MFIPSDQILGEGPMNFVPQSRADCIANRAASTFARIDNKTPVILCCPVLRIGQVQFWYLYETECGGPSMPVRHDWTRDEIRHIHSLSLPELLFRAQTVHRQFHRPE